MKIRIEIMSLIGFAFLLSGSLLLPNQVLAEDSGPGRAKWFQRGYERWLTEHPDYEKEFDKNGDGKLDPSEKKEAKKAWKEDKFEHWMDKHPQAAEKWDANKDGTLDENEKKEARRHWTERAKWKWQSKKNPPGPHGGPGRGPQ
ncbi:MAG TPA: hypothetical protein VD913_01390 [bacterium]|nr:hypothetical protein [bacterium]